MSNYHLFLAFVFGLKHGLDPDHLAIINGISFNDKRQNIKRWTGFFFSLGHGFTVTLIGILIVSVVNFYTISKTFMNVTEWLPIVLLLATGFYGLFLQLKNRQEQMNWKTKMFQLSETSSKFKFILVGIVFALVFDTSSQTLAWTLAVNETNKVFAAISIGVLFTLGMMLTDTLNSLLFAFLLKASNRENKIKIIQKVIAWVVIISSLYYGFIQLFSKLNFSTHLFTFTDNLLKIILLSVPCIGTIFFINKKIKKCRSSH